MQIFLILALLIGIALAVVVFLSWLLLCSKSQPKRRCIPDTDADWDHFHQLQSNAMLPALLNMFMNQMMQIQQDQHQQEVEQFWMIQESTNDLPTFSDSAWDL